MASPVRQESKWRNQKQSINRHEEGMSTGEHVHTHTSSSSRAGGSNLDCILQYTTPSVQCQYPPKSSVALCERWKHAGESIPMPFFNLGDLWRSFDEWSAYGAGVPLRLPSGETIVQYYVPYLSALQIYLHPGSSFFLNNRRLGDESDWSEGSDPRDASSDFGSDNEHEKMLSSLQIKTDQWESSSCVSLGRLSSPSSSEQADRQQQGELVFEYFELCSPYGRAPLAGKIGELATRFPYLLSLRSNELSPASWVSVAWYPIYRIPTGPTMSDLSTCFLTFHSLWSPPVLHDMATEPRASPGYSDACMCKLDQEQWLRDHLAWRVKYGTLDLPAFGLASYKLKGPFWASAAPADKRRASSLVASADSWLKQLGVQHPDFNFFISRG